MTSHIQIPPISPVIHYTGNGIQKAFTYPFPIFEDSQMIVAVNGATIPAGYNVTGSGKTDGGSVVFDTAPINGATVTLKRHIVIQRASDFIEGGELSSNALNNEFDRMTASLQQVDYAQKNSLAFNTNEPAPTSTLPLTAMRAGRVLGFDTLGRISMYEAGEATIPADYTQDGDHAVTRLLREKAAEFVSVQDFGAAGNGIQDDTAALRNVLAAHDSIYLPAGTYKISGTIEIGDHKKITGCGTATIIQTSDNTFDAIDLIGSHAMLSDFVIQGGETGIRLYGKEAPCHHNMLSNLILRDQSVGIELDGYIAPHNQCADHLIRNIYLENPSHYGILVTRSGAGAWPQNNLFSDIYLRHTLPSALLAGFYVEAGRNHNRFVRCSTAFTVSPNQIIQIGAESRTTYFSALQNLSPITGTGILLENGSQQTSLHDVNLNTTGTVLSDLSGGQYTLLQTQDNLANNLKATQIADLTTGIFRHKIRTIVSTGPITVSADLSQVTHLVNALAGEVTLSLPKASAANNGAMLIVKKMDNSTNGVIIAETGGNGPDGLTFRLGTINDILSVQSDGSAWRILYSNIDLARTFYIAGSTFYSPDVTKQIHFVSAASGVTTVELPPVSIKTNVGRMVTIKKLDSSSNAVRVTVAGSTGPDGAVVSLATNNAAITVIASDAGWHTVSRL